jgi:hypothetical protein
MGLKLNGTHQLVVSADDVYLLGDNIDTLNETKKLIYANKEVSLEVTAEKTKNMLLSHHQSIGQNHDIKAANECFENVAHLRYLGMTITNGNLIQEGIERRLNSGNAYYHSVQNLLSFHLPSVVLYGYET